MSTVNMPAKILFKRASMGSGHLHDSGSASKNIKNNTFVRAEVVFRFTDHHASDLRMVL
jgi:hypothetical protein